MIDIWVIYFNLSCADILGAMKRVVPDGKDITMDNFLYRLYVHLWRDCYPLRMFLLPGKSLLSRHLRKQSQLMHLKPVSPPALKIVLCQGDGSLDTHDKNTPKQQDIVSKPVRIDENIKMLWFFLDGRCLLWYTFDRWIRGRSRVRFLPREELWFSQMK